MTAPLTAVPARPLRPWLLVGWGLVTAVIVLAFWSIDISWARLADLPAEIVRYTVLMFGDPNWEKLPRPCGRPGGASRWPGSAPCSASSSRHP